MRVQKRNPWLYSLGVMLAAMALGATQAAADTTSDRPGSVVIWPKVVADGTRDTLITLTNTRNETAYAHCEYTNAIGICSISQQHCTLPSESAVLSAPACPGGAADVCVLGLNPEFPCATLDFDVILTRQQPTIWRVSTGRIYNPALPADGSCDLIPGVPPRQECPGFFLVGQVVPPVQPFYGNLRCIQVAADGTPMPSNGLKGEAIIETLGSTQISEYNSINILGTVDPDPADYLELNGTATGYNACPESVEFTNYSPGANDAVAASIDPAACAVSGCPVTTEITVIPCRYDFENEIPTRFQLDIVYHNEFEQRLSVERPFTCGVTFTLQNLGFGNLGGSTFQRTRINPAGTGLCIAGVPDELNTPCSTDAQCGAGGVCAPPSAILSIVEEFHDSDVTLTPLTTTRPGTDAANGYSVDVNGDGDVGRLGACRGAITTTTCSSDTACVGGGCVAGACPTGLCRVAGTPCTTSAQCTDDGDFCDRCMNDELRFNPAEVEIVQ